MVRQAALNGTNSYTKPCQKAVDHFRQSLKNGRGWFEAMLESMCMWAATEEVFRGKTNHYLIDGEAFDWPLLAERLCAEARGLVPADEKKALLETGKLPEHASYLDFKRLLGSEKYRSYLNFYYGVVVEKAIMEAAEDEVRKAKLAKGFQKPYGISEEAFFKVYQASKDNLIKAFKKAKGYSYKKRVSPTESKEFIYWLFKFRLNNSDKAKLASDTKKGLERLHKMGAIQPPNGNGSARYGGEGVVRKRQTYIYRGKQ